MCNISVFASEMRMISNFSMFVTITIFITTVCYKSDNGVICFFSRLVVLITCSFKDAKNVFMRSLLLYTSCLFSMSSNVHIVEIGDLDGICSFAFSFVGFIYFFLKKFKIFINNTCYLIRSPVLIKL